MTTMSGAMTRSAPQRIEAGEPIEIGSSRNRVATSVSARGGRRSG